MQRRILLTGGGSGGHVYPLLAVAHELQRIVNEHQAAVKLYYFGPADRYEEVIRKEGIQTMSLAAAKVRRYASLANFLDIPKFFWGLLQAFWKLYWLMPDAIFSKGGPGAFPVVFAGWFYRIPIMIHESDAVPGVTNLLSSRFAKRIAVSFENAAQYFPAKKTAVVGNPIREELTRMVPDKARAKEELGFDPNSPLLLVLGGSLGSQRLNEFVLLSLKDLIGVVQVLHQTGQVNYNEVVKMAKAVLVDVVLEKEVKTRYQAVPYFEQDYKRALAAADIALARAGASTIFELAAFGTPAVFVPLLESANDHQRVNAYEAEKAGSAIVIEEPNLIPGIFLNQLKTLLADETRRATMGESARAFYKPGAAALIAEEVLHIAQYNQK